MTSTEYPLCTATTTAIASLSLTENFEFEWIGSRTNRGTKTCIIAAEQGNGKD